MITLRAPEPSDLDWLYALENDPDIWSVSQTRQPYSRHTLLQHISNHADLFADRQLRLICCLENKPIGIVDFYDFEPFHRRCGIGIIINHESRNQGLGKKALQQALDYGKKFAGIRLFFAAVLHHNSASIRLFETLNFSLCGSKPHWHLGDDGLYYNELTYVYLA